MSEPSNGMDVRVREESRTRVAAGDAGVALHLPRDREMVPLRPWARYTALGMGIVLALTVVSVPETGSDRFYALLGSMALLLAGVTGRSPLDWRKTGETPVEIERTRSKDWR